MNILIIKPSSMGEIIQTLPAVSDAMNIIPNLHVDWVVEEAFTDIPEMHKGVNRAIPVAWQRWRKHFFKALVSGEIKLFLQFLRAHKYDYIIDAHGLIKSAMLSLFAHGKRCGLDAKSGCLPFAAHFYQRKFSVPKEQHAIARMRQLFALVLGYPLPNTEPDYGINLEKIIIPPRSEKYILFIHGSSRIDKCWPEKQWVELANIVQNNGYFVYLPWGSTDELRRAEAICKISSKIKVLRRKSLDEITPIIANACGIVAIDTGLGHIAAALGVPTVTLYGPSDPKLIGTVGKNQKHLVNFNTLTAKQVWSALQELMQQTSQSSL